MAIRSRLGRLRVNKEEAEKRKLPYRVIAEETGISQNVMVRLMNSNFERVDVSTLDRLCNYFDCQVGDLLVYEPD